MNIRNDRRWVVGLTALMLAIVACTCGPLADLTTELDQAGTELEQVGTELEEMAEEVATSAVQYSTAIPDDIPDDQTDTGSGDLPVFDGSDGYDTEFVDFVGLDTQVSATFTDIFLAHNWVFEGQAGMPVQIVVSGGADEIDTRAQLLDPAGDLLVLNDDTNGLDPLINATLPSDGLYTVRIDAWDEGSYTLIVITGG